jgi:hypothetical protein
MKVVHCIKSLTKAALWNDHFNDVREISLDSLRALSAFVTGHVRVPFNPNSSPNTKRRDSCGFQCLEVNGSLKRISASLAVPDVPHAAVINVF